MLRAETEFGVARRAGVKRSRANDVEGKTLRDITPTRYSNYGIIAGIYIRSPSQGPKHEGGNTGTTDTAVAEGRGHGENILLASEDAEAGIQNRDSGLPDSPDGVRRLYLEVSLFSQYPMAFEEQSPRLLDRSSSLHMSTVEFVNAFRVYHALLSIIDTAFKKLRVRQTGETNSPHPIEVAVHISFCRIYLLSNFAYPRTRTGSSTEASGHV